MSILTQHRPVQVILGPTNTGKTYLAIERMLTHKSGIIGLPLRLLAREVYQKIVARVGVDRVALITGEERIKPFSPDYWVATIESMPLDIDVECIVVDEIQLAADLDRGHTFTDRVLNMRGSRETLLLGAQTVRPILENVLVKPTFISRPRFSALTFSGHRKLSRLRPRTAVIAFSVGQVYAIAEFIKRERGGVAVILGALSPRTRNAQVSLYQSGEVDYFVATDAVGMGLNLDVDHVMFAGLSKFDGFQVRALLPTEMAQVAGRAGRYQNDGTFGVTGAITSLDPDLVHRLENHVFEPEKVLQWRNTDLNFSSMQTLRQSLDKHPVLKGLVRAPMGDDVKVLEQLMLRPGVQARATNAQRVDRLWECCQLPDYVKLSPNHHRQIVEDIYGFVADGGMIDNDWFAGQLKRCENLNGEIDALSARIADIRTWSYAANREDWLDISEGWRQKTMALENALSDRLHQLITNKFVDRKTSVLMRRLKETKTLQADVNETGEIAIESESFGCLNGFRFMRSRENKNVTRLAGDAIEKTAGEALVKRAEAFMKVDNKAITLSNSGELLWGGDVIGRLSAGSKLYQPSVTLIADEVLDSAVRTKVADRLKDWVKDEVTTQLSSLEALMSGLDLEAGERGIAVQVAESFGVLERVLVADEVKALDHDARRRLRLKGIKFGAYSLFMPLLLKPLQRKLVMVLAVLNEKISVAEGEALHQVMVAGRTSLKPEALLSDEAYRLAGYRPIGHRMVRVDVLERVADLIRSNSMWRPDSGLARPEGVLSKGFIIQPSMLSLLGCGHSDMRDIMLALGYRLNERLRSDVEAELAAHTAEALALEMEDDPFPVPPKPLDSPQTDTVMPGGDSAQAEVKVDTPKIEAKADIADSEAPPVEPEKIDVWYYLAPKKHFKAKNQESRKGKDQPNSRAAKGEGGNDETSAPSGTRQNKKFKAKKGKAAFVKRGASAKGDSKGFQAKPIDPDSPFAKLAELMKK